VEDAVTVGVGGAMEQMPTSQRVILRAIVLVAIRLLLAVFGVRHPPVVH
jgi:hypothetical protein